MKFVTRILVIMPAQKLTKARLAQILIMLSLLVGAFFWRTFTHETSTSVECSQKERCDVTIGEDKITINRDSSGILIETTESTGLKIDLNQSGVFDSISDNHYRAEWNAISATKTIKLKINQNIV
ncbi:hypothetical protein CGK42_21070, partial [Vibrio parahaemolyticus]